MVVKQAKAYIASAGAGAIKGATGAAHKAVAQYVQLNAVSYRTLALSMQFSKDISVPDGAPGSKWAMELNARYGRHWAVTFGLRVPGLGKADVALKLSLEYDFSGVVTVLAKMLKKAVSKQELVDTQPPQLQLEGPSAPTAPTAPDSAQDMQENNVEEENSVQDTAALLLQEQSMQGVSMEAIMATLMPQVAMELQEMGESPKLGQRDMAEMVALRPSVIRMIAQALKVKREGSSPKLGVKSGKASEFEEW